MESTALSILALMAIGLLLAVSGGVMYLTAVEWRDRRRQQQKKRF